MKYGILISLFLMITNCVAMDAEVDWTNEYKKHAQIWYKGFPEKEQEMLRNLSEIIAKKEDLERYELAAQCFKQIYDYSKQSKRRFDFLESSIGLLDSRNTFHRDFDMKHVLVKEILKTIESQIEDGPSEDDSDI